MSSSSIASMTSLEYIDLSGNPFEGLFSFSLIANHSKLKMIQIICYDNEFEIETEFPSGQPLFQLKALVLSNLNKFTGNIPKFLFDQHELEVIDISHSMLKGSFPTWLLENNTRLQRLNLRGNSLVGQFHLPPYHNKDILWLDVSENHLHGQLQENLGKLIPKIECLYLSRNLFEGNFPSSIGDMSNLKKLDLSFNNFSGEVPMKLIANHTWDILRLSNNNFHGEIFSKHFNLSIQYYLELNNNYFIGTLPLISSEVVDISNNHMSGIIPKWIGNSTLNRIPSVLFMNDNLFKGQVPCELGQYNVIDLSHNLLSRLLPSCLNVQNAGHILLQGNKLTGTLPKAIFNSSFLMTLDIRDNNFFGSIPDEIDGLSNLRVLLLSGNHFSGMISRQLCQLEKIGLMDLSKNFFSGTIPYCFYNITFGKLDLFDLAYVNSFPTLVSNFHIAKFNHLRILDFTVRELILEFGEQVGIDFVTKYRSSFYKGFILDIMFGLDLSFNKLTGEIPPELGQLSSILTLNLSYNQLTGPIPKTFSKLAQLESLDLSHNNLSGEIPTALIDLTFLAVFNVSHNNLSGKLPDMKAQFATFENSSYEGNPFLCGPPLEKSCSEVNESLPSPQQSSKASDGKWYEVDLPVFSTSFLVSFIVFFLVVVSILYINPHWRQQCFNLVEDRMFWCYYFASKTLKRLSNRMFH